MKNAADYGSPPDWRWAQQYGGSSADISYDIVTDEAGDIYITGSFSGHLTYPGFSFTSIGKRDVFVAKFSSSGTIQWCRQFPASASDKIINAYGIEHDNNGKIYITGYYTSTITLGSFELPDMGISSFFYARLDASGNVELAGGPAIPHEDQQTGIAVKVDNGGNIYLLVSNSLDYHSVTNKSSIICFNVSGNVLWENSLLISVSDFELSNNKIFYSGTINEQGYVGPFFLDPPYTRDAFLARSDLNGNFEWAQIPGHDVSNGHSQGYGISIDENGSIYQCGFFWNDVKFGENDLNGSRTFVVKADPDGGYLWAQMSVLPNTFNICGNNNFIVVSSSNILTKFNSTTGENLESQSISHSPDKLNYSVNNDRIVTTGDFENNLYISSFTASLNLLWLLQFSGDSGFGSNIGTCSDQEGNIYTFNYASNPMDYLGEPVGEGMFLAKQDNSGNLIWLKNFYGTRQNNDVGCYVLADNLTGSVYITGTFTEPFDIPGVTTLYPGGFSSFYIIRYDNDGNYVWHIQEDALIQYNCLAVDHSGNVLLSAIFSGSIIIGNQELTSIEYDDAFIAKFDSAGHFIWAVSGGGEDEEYIGLISTDSQDNIYFTGEFDSQNVTFGDQSITLNEGDGNILLAKLNSSGQVLWLKVKGGSPVAWRDYYGWPTTIVTSDDGYSYIKGWHGDSTYFDNTLLTNPFSVKKNYNFFIGKFDPSGNTVWVHSISESQQGLDYNMMDVDSEGNIYLGAQLRDSIWFEYDYTANNTGYPIDRDLFIAKYSSGGNLDWVKILQSDNMAGGNCLISSIRVLAENDLIMGGYFSGSLNMDSFILNSDMMHGMMARLGGPLSVEETPDLTTDFFSLYPNPARDRLFIIFSEDLQGEMIIAVTDLSGREIFKSSGIIKDRRISIFVSDLPAGIYFVKATNLKQIGTRKFVIE